MYPFNVNSLNTQLAKCKGCEMSKNLIVVESTTNFSEYIILHRPVKQLFSKLLMICSCCSTKTKSTLYLIDFLQLYTQLCILFELTIFIHILNLLILSYNGFHLTRLISLSIYCLTRTHILDSDVLQDLVLSPILFAMHIKSVSNIIDL